MHPNKEKREMSPKRFDFKNTEMLREYVNPHARIQSRRRTGLSSKEQRDLAMAIKRARFMALMPYISR